MEQGLRLGCQGESTEEAYGQYALYIIDKSYRILLSRLHLSRDDRLQRSQPKVAVILLKLISYSEVMDAK